MKSKWILLFILSIISCSKRTDSKEIIVKTDYNIETLAICFEIADKGFWNFPFEDYQPMKRQARNKFEGYRNHKAIQVIDSLVDKGFWLDAMMEVMLKSSQVPNSKLVHDIEPSTLTRLSSNTTKALALINELVNSLNAFYVDANLRDYFQEHKNYYKSVNNEVARNLPNKHFVTTMENYYGKENASYTLIPSPTIYHTMGFGKNIKADKGFEVFNIFGPVIATKDSLEFGYGFDDNSEINELSTHEFGHSFINPVLESAQIKLIIKASEHLFEPIREAMKKQGYGTWETCVAEHLVRLGEIRIAYALGDSIRAKRIREHYINNRKFIYLTQLEESIKNYEDNRTMYKTIDAFIPKLLKSLK